MSESDQGKVIVCRAAVAWSPKQPLSLEVVEVAPPKAHEVRVKIVSTAVCHTDHTLGTHNHLEGNFPVILGHEGAGIVESVGKNVTKFKPGDHVIPLFLSQCYDCAFCKNPETNLCGKIMATQEKGLMPDGTTRFTCKGQPIFHFMGCSTFAEYTVVPDISLCKINEKAPLNKVCLLGCGVATGYGAAINNAKVKPGSVCGVWGLGTVGLAAAMGCRKAGAAKVYGIDLNPSKFELARKFGCTDFVNPKDYEGQNMKDVLVKLTNGGFDHTIECIGNIHTMRLALESTHAGWGRSVIIGASSPELEVSTKPLRLMEGRTWTGTIFGGWKSVDSIPKLVEEYMRGELQLDEFITHTMKLDKINEAFDLLLSGKSLRTVLEF